MTICNVREGPEVVVLVSCDSFVTLYKWLLLHYPVAHVNPLLMLLGPGVSGECAKKIYVWIFKCMARALITSNIDASELSKCNLIYMPEKSPADYFV